MKGKRWITNGQTSLVIKKDDPVPDGYHYGRFKSDKMLNGYKIGAEKKKKRTKLPKFEINDIMHI